MDEPRKPTLHEIAAMPFPQSERALEEHYGVKPKREHREGEIRTFEVVVRYSERINDSVMYEIEAASPKEAEEIAERRAGNEIPIDADIDDIEVSEVTQ